MQKATMLSIVVLTILLSVAITAEAQEPKKVYRIGYLSPRPGIESREEAFRQGLRELGYIEGQNLIIEWRFTKGKTGLYSDFANELVRLKPDCMVVTGVGPVAALK